jgi:hypothetical protein
MVRLIKRRSVGRRPRGLELLGAAHPAVIGQALLAAVLALAVLVLLLPTAAAVSVHPTATPVLVRPTAAATVSAPAPTTLALPSAFARKLRGVDAKTLESCQGSPG